MTPPLATLRVVTTFPFVPELCGLRKSSELEGANRSADAVLGAPDLGPDDARGAGSGYGAAGRMREFQLEGELLSDLELHVGDEVDAAGADVLHDAFATIKPDRQMGRKPLVPALLYLSQERLPTWTAVRPPRAGTSEWPAFGSAEPHRPGRARSRTRFSGMGASPLFERIAKVRKGRASQGNQSLPNRIGRRCKKIRRYRTCRAESTLGDGQAR